MPETLTTVRERPFIAKPHEVRAMRENRMSQFRRPMRLQPQSVDTVAHKSIPYTGSAEFLMEHTPCPFGAPGDILWLKETWAPHDIYAIYKADLDDWSHLSDIEGHRWRSPVTMPRHASRLTLEIVDERAERVCEISDEDAYASGMERLLSFPSDPDHYNKAGYIADGVQMNFRTARDAYADFWIRTFGKRHPWESAWAWAVTFKLVQPC